jgi:hypothetical protein
VTAPTRILAACLVTLAAFLFHTPAYGQGSFQRTPAPFVTLFDIPREMFLCGERVPLERQDVWESLDQILISSVYSQAQVILWIKRATAIFRILKRDCRKEKCQTI